MFFNGKCPIFYRSLSRDIILLFIKGNFIDSVTYTHHDINSQLLCKRNTSCAARDTSSHHPLRIRVGPSCSLDTTQSLTIESLSLSPHPSQTDRWGWEHGDWVVCENNIPIVLIVYRTIEQRHRKSTIEKLEGQYELSRKKVPPGTHPLSKFSVSTKPPSKITFLLDHSYLRNILFFLFSFIQLYNCYLYTDHNIYVYIYIYIYIYI